MDKLLIHNFPTNHPLPALEEENFILKTCQRTLVISRHENSSLDGLAKEKYAGPAAYQFLLEVICGLQSHLVAESEISAQFKTAYNEYTKKEKRCTKIMGILEKLFKDSKEVRKLFLNHLGQHSYASIARSLIAKKINRGPALILGSGTLAFSLTKLLKKKYDITIQARNIKTATEICETFHVQYLNWEEKSQYGNFPIIINTIGASEILFDEHFFEQWLTECKIFIDLSSPSPIQTPFHASQDVYRLEDIFKETGKRTELKEKQITVARELIASLSKKRSEMNEKNEPSKLANNTSPKTYRVGTRGSLLALTQSQAVLRELEEKTQAKFVIEVIKTQGDIQTQKPLWQLKGENFFTRELDEALLKKTVDLVVHSFKDLSVERPKEFALAAIPKRKYPHDILLIKKSTITALSSKTTLTVGTSSPRRIFMVEHFLKDLIPFGDKLQIQTNHLRGNVNTRLKALHEGQFDAIILALAGLERLADDKKSQADILPLLEDLDFLVLPASIFTPAAAQGALAIECLNENAELIDIIKTIDDEQTRKEALKEKELFSVYGGGCHQAIGIQVKSHPAFELELHQGEKEGQKVSKMIMKAPRPPLTKTKNKAFIGLAQNEEELFFYDELSHKKELAFKGESCANFLVTSKHCIALFEKNYQAGTVWTSGTNTLKNLVKKGHWVNGSADFFGTHEIEHFSHSNFLNLLFTKDYPWQVLTARESHSDFAPITPCYERSWKRPSETFKAKILSTEIFYWSSFPQFEAYLQEFPTIKNKIHACGPGKTYDEFKTHALPIFVFSSINEFKEWYHEQTK